MQYQWLVNKLMCNTSPDHIQTDTTLGVVDLRETSGPPTAIRASFTFG
jgi:hypothetical protein